MAASSAPGEVRCARSDRACRPWFRSPAQSLAWILSCRKRTSTRSSGTSLRSAYRRRVIDVQAPSAGKQIVVGAGPVSRPPATLAGSSARSSWRPTRDALGEASLPVSATTTSPGHRASARRPRARQVAACPGGQHLGDVDRIGAAGQQMIGVVERDEALGMLGGGEDVGRACSMPTTSSRGAWNTISALPEPRDVIASSRCAAMSSRNCRLTRKLRPPSTTSASPWRLDLGARRRTGGRRGRDRRARRWSRPRPPRAPARRRQHGRAAERVTDQDLGRRVFAARRKSAASDRPRVRREVGVGELASLPPRPVKSKRSTARPRSARPG